MTWTPIVANRRHLQRGEWVSVGARKEGKNFKPRVRITISQPLVERLGWRRGHMIQVLVGSGEHAGKLLLRPAKLDPGGYTLMQQPQAGKAYTLGVQPWAGADPELRINAAKWAMDGEDGLIVYVDAPPPQLSPQNESPDDEDERVG